MTCKEFFVKERKKHGEKHLFNNDEYHRKGLKNKKKFTLV